MSIEAEFAGKPVVISGGTKGLGRATVERFRAGGARIMTAARNHPHIVRIGFEPPLVPAMQFFYRVFRRGGRCIACTSFMRPAP